MAPWSWFIGIMFLTQSRGLPLSLAAAVAAVVAFGGLITWPSISPSVAEMTGWRSSPCAHHGYRDRPVALRCPDPTPRRESSGRERTFDAASHGMCEPALARTLGRGTMLGGESCELEMHRMVGAGSG